MADLPTSPIHPLIESWFDWPMQLDDFPRVRQVVVNVDEPQISVLTRTGGDNREDYAELNEPLCDLEGYDHDEDEADDHTFAWWYYNIPERSQASWREYCALVQKVEEEEPATNTAE